MQPLAGTPPLDSPQFWQQPFRVPASSDPETATAQTIGIMCGHVRGAVSDLLVQEIAAAAVQQFAGLAGNNQSDAAGIAAACWWWCKVYITFTHHEALLRRFLGEAGHLQGLISPEVLIRMDSPEGDCAIFTECLAAFLTCLGVPFEIVTVAVNPEEPDIFSHVYLYAVLPDGSRMALDASHGEYPGWQVPSNRVSRRQVWDSAGHRVSDRGSRFDGLHNYGWGRWRGGLGATVCDAEGGNCYDNGIPDVPLSCPGQVGCPGYVAPVDAGIPLVYVCADGSTVGAPSLCATPASAAPAYTAPTGTPSNNSAQWAAFSTALLKSGLTLAEINAIQPGTVVGANGQIVRQTAGYAVPVGSTSSLNLGTALGSNSSMLMLLAVGAGALLLLGSKR